MEEIKVFIERLSGNEDMSLPRYMTGGSAGMDIFAAVTKEEFILPGKRKIVPTGITIALPEGYEAEVRPRSGLAIRNGITLINSPGTIDADYRGEIKVALINHGEKPFIVRRGDRIAQMVIHRVCRATWDLKNGLDETSRGEGGFGHTG
jgi:dUTP pyrophosphatase